MLASTSEIYGDPLVHPQREDYAGNVDVIGPRGVYDEAKRFAEALTMAYHRTHKVDTRIARIFNTYGPRMRLDDGRVVPNFVGQALRGEPLTVYGDGSQTRSFCYVSDLIEGIYRLLMSEFDQPVNIGNPSEMTILQFAELGTTDSNRSRGRQGNCVSRASQTRQPIIARRRTFSLGAEVDLPTGLSVRSRLQGPCDVACDQRRRSRRASLGRVAMRRVRARPAAAEVAIALSRTRAAVALLIEPVWGLNVMVALPRQVLIETEAPFALPGDIGHSRGAALGVWAVAC